MAFRGKLAVKLRGCTIHGTMVYLPTMNGFDSYGQYNIHRYGVNMGVSKNRGTPKSSILIGFPQINHPFWGTPIFGNTHIPNNTKPVPWILSLSLYIYIYIWVPFTVVSVSVRCSKNMKKLVIFVRTFFNLEVA